MRASTFSRCAALVGAGVLFLGAPATAAAQPTGSIDTSSLDSASGFFEVAPESLGNAAGGSLASVGLPDLGSAVAGGQCVASDPAIGSFYATPLSVRMESKEGSPGVAHTEIEGGSWFANTSGVLHWTNETTGDTGEEPFGPFSGDVAYAYFDLPTGAGEVTWSIDAEQEGPPLSLVLPLGLVGSSAPFSVAPYTSCSGTAEIA